MCLLWGLALIATWKSSLMLMMGTKQPHRECSMKNENENKLSDDHELTIVECWLNRHHSSDDDNVYAIMRTLDFKLRNDLIIICVRLHEISGELIHLILLIRALLKKWESSKAHQARSVAALWASQYWIQSTAMLGWQRAAATAISNSFALLAAVVRDETGLSRSLASPKPTSDGRMKLCLHVSIQQRRIRVTRYYIHQAGWHTHDERGFFMNST